MAKYRPLKGATPSTRKRKTDASVPMYESRRSLSKRTLPTTYDKSVVQGAMEAIVPNPFGGVQSLQLPPHRMKSYSKRPPVTMKTMNVKSYSKRPRKYKTPKPKK